MAVVLSEHEDDGAKALQKLIPEQIRNASPLPAPMLRGGAPPDRHYSAASQRRQAAV